MSAQGPDGRGSNRWAAAGEAEQNESYVGLRLQYTRATEVETAFAGLIPAGQLSRFLRRALLAAAVVGLIVAALNYSDSQPSDALRSALPAAVIAFVLSLLIPYREVLSEWQIVLDGKGAAADSAYAAIYGTLRNREVPAQVKPRRIRNQLRRGASRNYLVVTDAHYTVYVSVFGYGTGLYLGWSMWRRQLPILMFVTAATHWFSALFGKGSLFHLLLRAERAKALREVVHNAVREGVEVAASGISVPRPATFGFEVPVETETESSPGPAPPSVRPPMPPQAPPAPAAGSPTPDPLREGRQH